MALRRVAVLVGLLACVIAGRAAAQVPMTGNLPTFDTAPPAPPPGAMPPGGPMGPVPGGPPPGMAGPPPGMAGPPGAAQEPPCMKEFAPLRDAAEKRGHMIKNAGRKASRPEVCQLFKNFAVAEAKVVKFIVDKQSVCNIPQQAVTQMKANHERTVKTRDQICAGGPVGAGPAAPPPAPRLSDELGVRGVAGPETSSPGRGTFDTLTGNPLAR